MCTRCIARWKERFDQIPADSKDPNLLKAKKALKKKEPTRSPERQYWNQQQFEKLEKSPPGELISRGALPWRLLAYMLQLSPDVEFERPEVDTTASTVVIVCRGSVPKAKIKVAIRVEGIAKHVRSTSVYDHTGLSSDDFRKWSAAIFAGVK